MADSIQRPQMPSVDLNQREGLLVQSLDGRTFFLSEAEMNRAELQGIAHERASLSNTPFTDQWLGVAAWFFDECAGGGRVA